jgi:hypothetical protein
MKKEHKKISFERKTWNCILIISALLLLSSAVLSQTWPDPGHPAGEIGGGSFNDTYGNFYFPVGIDLGIGLLSTYSTLTVNGTGDDSSDGGILIQGSDAGANATLYFRQDAEAMDAAIKWTQTGGISRIGFYLDNSSAGYVDSNEYLTILEDGKVGIGTTDPEEALHVDGSINVTAGNDICIDGGNCISNHYSYTGNCGADSVPVYNDCELIPDCDLETQTLNYDANNNWFECGSDDLGGTMSSWTMASDSGSEVITQSENVQIIGNSPGIITAAIATDDLEITNEGDHTPDTIADDGTIVMGIETSGNYAKSNSEGGPALDLDCNEECVNLSTETIGPYCDNSTCADADFSSTNEMQDLWETISTDGGSTIASEESDSLTISGSSPISTSISAGTLTITGSAHTLSDTNASTVCSFWGTNYYLDGGGLCDSKAGLDARYILDVGEAVTLTSDMTLGSMSIDYSTHKVGVGTGTSMTNGAKMNVGLVAGSPTIGLYAGAGKNFGLTVNSGTWGMRGDGAASGVSVGAMGIGCNGVSGSAVVTGGSSSYCFYADSCGTEYYPFTGSHTVKLSDDFPEDALTGLIVSTTGEMEIHENKSEGIYFISDTLPTVQVSSKAYDKTVLGAFLAETGVGIEHWYIPKEGERFGGVNALGEGRLLASNVTGPLKAGDYITTSNIPGYAQKQDDDLLHSYTLAKVIEDVDWDGEYNTTEHDGKTYKTYLIAVIYVSG